jgi:hypothetical protein
VGRDAHAGGLAAMKIKDRFGMLEGERPVETSEPKAKVSQRFAGVDAPAPETPALEVEAKAERTHIRCMECAYDNNGPYSDTCVKCNASLRTRAVHHLNVRLHQEEQQVARTEVAVAAVDDWVKPRTLLDRLADKITVGSLHQRRALVVAAAGAILGFAYIITGWKLIGFLIALVVTIGICLIPT